MVCWRMWMENFWRQRGSWHLLALETGSVVEGIPKNIWSYADKIENVPQLSNNIYKFDMYDWLGIHIALGKCYDLLIFCNPLMFWSMICSAIMSRSSQLLQIIFISQLTCRNQRYQNSKVAQWLLFRSHLLHQCH